MKHANLINGEIRKLAILQAHIVGMTTEELAKRLETSEITIYTMRSKIGITAETPVSELQDMIEKTEQRIELLRKYNSLIQK
jgi:transposase